MIADAHKPGSPDYSLQTISISFETLIYAALIVGAVLLRFIGLSTPDLSSVEAPQAIAAYHLIEPMRSAGVGTIDSILVFAGAALSFAIATPTNAAARFVPMLTGIALTLSPLLFRHRLGRIGTLLLVLILSISPTAVTTSRQMNGAGLSMLGLMGMLACIDRYFATAKPSYALFTGLALSTTLLADFGALAALLSLIGGFAFAVITDEEGYLTKDTLQSSLRRFPVGGVLIGFIISSLLLSTLFFLLPAGLGVVGDQLARFFGGLVNRPADTPYLGLVVLAYEPLLLTFGLIGAWLASQSPLPWLRFLAGWGISAIIISLLYPGAIPAHSLWTVLPLGGLSALLLANLLTPVRRTPAWTIQAQGVATAALMAMIVANLAQQINSPKVCPVGAIGLQIPCNSGLIALAAILLTILWLLIVSVWGQQAAWHGAGLGIAATGLLMALGLSGSMAFTRPDNPYDLFNRSPADLSLPLLIHTAEAVSALSDGNPHQASVTVIGQSDDALKWALRDFANVHYVQTTGANTNSVMVITPMQPEISSFGENYVGQAFAVTNTWSPADLTLSQFVSWLVFRSDDRARLRQHKVILWVRADLYEFAPDKSLLRP